MKKFFGLRQENWLIPISLDDVATPSLLHIPRVLLAWRQHTGVAKINKAQIAQPPKKNESEEMKQDDDENEEEKEEKHTACDL